MEAILGKVIGAVRYVVADESEVASVVGNQASRQSRGGCFLAVDIEAGHAAVVRCRDMGPLAKRNRSGGLQINMRGHRPGGLDRESRPPILEVELIAIVETI